LGRIQQAASLLHHPQLPGKEEEEELKKQKLLFTKHE